MTFRPPRALLLSAILAAGLSAPGAALAQDAFTTADVNMRAGPGTQFRALTVLPEGSGVDVEGCSGGWCQVIYRGLDGYVSRSYLAFGGGRPAVVVPPPVYVPPPVIVYPPYRPGWGPPYRPRPPAWGGPGPRPPVVRPPAARPPGARPPGRPGWSGRPGDGMGRPPAGRPSMGRPGGGRPGRGATGPGEG